MPIGDLVARWSRLRESEGERVTLIELYRLAADELGMPAEELSSKVRLELKSRAMPLMGPGFEVVPGGERPAEAIELSAYDPGWPGLFRSWRLRLQEAVGGVALRIDHVGSTAVPGLAGKPVVDIQLSVANLEDERSYRAHVEGVGLRLNSRDHLHRYFRPGSGSPRTVHLHVCQSGSAWERAHLLFRDFLRQEAEARKLYLAAKRSAAAAWSDDRWAYTEAKTGVILELLDLAERWATAVGWQPADQRG